MATIEQQVKDHCEKHGYYYEEHGGSHFVVSTMDERKFDNNNHYLTVYIDRTRSEALRYLLRWVKEGTFVNDQPCDDDGCEVCEDNQ